MKQALVILMAIMFLLGVTVSTGWTQAGSDVKSFNKRGNSASAKGTKSEDTRYDVKSFTKQKNN